MSDEQLDMFTVLLEYIQNGDCSIRVYRSFYPSCNFTSKDSEYIENNSTYYASIMLDTFRYLLCSKLC